MGDLTEAGRAMRVHRVDKHLQMRNGTILGSSELAERRHRIR